MAQETVRKEHLRGAAALAHRWRLGAFRLAVAVPTVAFLTYSMSQTGVEIIRSQGLLGEVAFWIITIGLIELLPVPAWRSLQVSVALPLFMALAFLYDPWIAGAVAFLASSDPRELKGEVTLLHAIFNRSQAALAVLAASATFHAIAGDDVSSLVPLLPVALLAVLIDYAVNVTLVASDSSLMHGIPLAQVLRRFRIGKPLEFAVSYIGLGFLGLLLARLHDAVGAWAVAAFVMPLLLVRQMFFRTRALEDAARELQDREVVLRALSNRMAEERHDERSQIAGYLHDDLAQLLYRMSLHIDISRKHLAAGDPGNAIKELDSVENAKDSTLKMVRSLIKDLHRNPIGRAGLSEAISSLCGDVHKDFGLRTETSLQEVEMPPPIQLLCYHVTREAIMNVVKHAEANLVRVTMEPTTEGARVTIQDDGKGFDPEQGSPEGHFGLTMMRERAQISGGSLEITSEPGVGSTVVADFKTTWLDQASGSQLLGPVSRDREERPQ